MRTNTNLSCLAVVLALVLGAGSTATASAELKLAQATPPPAAAPPAPTPPPAATPPAAPAPAAAPASTRLVGLPAWSALVGNSISGMEDGKPLVEHYLADGSVKSMHGNEITTGTWALVGETVCFKYGNDTECYKIEVVDNTATYTDAKGVGTRYEILKGNPKNL